MFKLKRIKNSLLLIFCFVFCIPVGNTNIVYTTTPPPAEKKVSKKKKFRKKNRTIHKFKGSKQKFCLKSTKKKNDTNNVSLSFVIIFQILGVLTVILATILLGLGIGNLALGLSLLIIGEVLVLLLAHLLFVVNGGDFEDEAAVMIPPFYLLFVLLGVNFIIGIVFLAFFSLMSYLGVIGLVLLCSILLMIAIHFLIVLLPELY